VLKSIEEAKLTGGGGETSCYQTFDVTILVTHEWSTRDRRYKAHCTAEIIRFTLMLASYIKLLHYHVITSQTRYATAIVVQ